MRLLRAFPDQRSARMLVDALSDAGIESELVEARSSTRSPDEAPATNSFAVWVLDETHMARARQLAAEWLDAGSSETYERAAARGRGAREFRERASQRQRERAELAARALEARPRPKPPLLTWALIGACVLVALITNLGQDRSSVAALTIVSPFQRLPPAHLQVFGRDLVWLRLPWQEPWRLITPVLVHFAWLHILFNMLWLRDLGRVIEYRHGALYLFVFVVLSGVLPNIAQYQLARSPMFGGMSGVVYGLLGLIWVRGHLDRRAGYALSRFTVQFMLIWLAVGFVGNMGVANWCHLFGLLTGMIWGFVSARRAR